DDYIAGVQSVACQEEENEEYVDMEEKVQGQQQNQELNAKVLYDSAAKESGVRPSNSVSMQNIAHENAPLRRENARLQQENRDKDNALQQNKVTRDLILVCITEFLFSRLYRDLGKTVLEQALHLLSTAQAIATGSSHVGSESITNDNANNAADGHSGEELDGANKTLETSHRQSGNQE
ncbi:hypothetical protein ABZP36_027855, partial [Zizania latifolia]